MKKIWKTWKPRKKEKVGEPRIVPSFNTPEK